MELTCGSRFYVSYVVGRPGVLPADLTVRGLLANAGSYGLELDSVSYEDPRRARRVPIVENTNRKRKGLPDAELKAAGELFEGSD